MKKHRKSRPKPVDVELFSKRIIELYVEKKFSISKIVKIIEIELNSTQCLRQSVISNFLKREMIFRNHSETMIITSNQKTKQSICIGCNVQYEAMHKNEKWCKICAPTPQDVTRLRVYGLTKAKFDLLLISQQNSCALCQKSFFNDLKPHQNKSLSIVVDHDHKNNQVRGLLCSPCNVAIGYIEKRSHEWLVKVQDYVGKAS